MTFPATLIPCSLALLLVGVSASAAEVGATVPWVRYEAEDGAAGGAATVLGPNRHVGDLAGEASGRRAVKLTGEGGRVEWTATAPSNSIVIRHCIPDSADGLGQKATLTLLVNGERRGPVALTSQYAWLYGPEENPKNDPSLGQPRRIYDDARRLLDFTIQPGDRVALTKTAGAAHHRRHGRSKVPEYQTTRRKANPAQQGSQRAQGHRSHHAHRRRRVRGVCGVGDFAICAWP